MCLSSTQERRKSLRGDLSVIITVRRGIDAPVECTDVVHMDHLVVVRAVKGSLKKAVLLETQISSKAWLWGECEVR